ncbi:MAG TPA: restriction endonuclease, partial [Nitrospirae bacterium]|nr:restriction endonuclease [Nitrospirota bacterium]
IFPDIIFEESDTELDHAGDIDYVAKVGDRAFGIQIKPITAKANFGNYSPTERMKASFSEFEEQYGGKVFVVFSMDGEIGNQEVIEQIRQEIERLKK